MTVGEFVQQLMEYPEDMEIVGTSDDGSREYPMDISLHTSYINEAGDKWEDNTDTCKKVLVVDVSN